MNSIIDLEIILELCPFLTKETTIIGTIKYIYKYIPREDELHFVNMSLEKTANDDWLFFWHVHNLPPKSKIIPDIKLDRILERFIITMWMHLVSFESLIKAKRGSDLTKLVDILQMMSQQYQNRCSVNDFGNHVFYGISRTEKGAVKIVPYIDVQK